MSLKITIPLLKDKFKEMNFNGKLPTKKQDLIDLYEKTYGPLVKENAKENLTVIQLKKKITELGYTGKIPTRKPELIKLYNKLERGDDGTSISPPPPKEREKTLTVIQLKKKIAELGYTGKMPTRKPELIELCNKLERGDGGFKYTVVENTDFKKLVNELGGTKDETLPRSVLLEEGIKHIKKLVPNTNIAVMNLNTTTNKFVFECYNETNDGKWIFLLVKDKKSHFDFVKIGNKLVYNQLDIPPSVYKKLMDECKSVIPVTTDDRKLTIKEFEGVSKLTLPELRLLFQQKNYIGKLPIHKQELLNLFKKLFVVDTEEETTKNYDTMSLQEIIDELRQHNITHNLPRQKHLLLELLKAPKCNPVEGKWCDADKTCDIMNNICINQSKIKKTAVQEVIEGGHRIAGSKAMIQIVKEKIKSRKSFDEEESNGEFETHIHSDIVSNKEQLLVRLKVLNQTTLETSFNSFLKSVL